MGGSMNLGELLSLSAQFEEGLSRPRAEAPGIAALRLLAELEGVARASLAHQTAFSPPPPRASRPVASPPPAAARPSTVWSTRSKAYRPALGDPSVIEALLKYRDQAPSIEAPSVARIQASPPPVPAKPEPIFEPEIRPAELERISATDLEPCFPFAPSSNLLRPRR